jgi:phosphodiesterase/alkaline phosphatase D-like protein
MKVFEAIPKNNPYFLLHTGDYTYPDYQISHDYSAHYDQMAYSYQKRYDEKVMKQMLHTIPIDYIYDDNDYVGGSGGRYEKDNNTQYSKLFFGTENKIWGDSFPDFWRSNCIKGYMDFFPGYEMVDTNFGVFHSFKFGNAEFFFLDRCANTPHANAYAFKYDEKRNKYTFDPPADHVLFGKEQMDWLKNGLKNSKADWKFIVSGVPLNRNLVILINAGLRLQNIGWKGNNGFRLGSGFAHYWAGHPAEINDFYHWLKKENLKDIVVISGDTHHNVMDDGRNAGLAEMNASGMSVTETYLAYYLKIIGKVTGLFKLKKEVWNQGGQGFGNKNFKNAFGKVRIVNNEYVEMSIVDEDNEVVSSFQLYHSSTPKGAKHHQKLNW